MRKIRVLIVEDSSVVRQLLEHIVGRDPRLEVAGAAASGEEALQILDRIAPDVISMDIRLPGMNGFETTERVMRERPTPIVVVSASVEKEELQITMNALQAGALTVLEKPEGVTAAGYEALAERLCTQLVIMSQVKVVGRRGSARPVMRKDPRAAGRAVDYRALGIVSSTGGPGAVVRLLGGLGSDFDLPILLVQHITASFLEGFAAWLDRNCPFSVELVTNCAALHPRRVYMAAADAHLRLGRGGLSLDHSEPVGGQRPSGTILFDSMAQALGGQALGVILTGMGTDGAEGLLRLRNAGGYTIAEDQSTAIVFGMPAEAERIGAVCESLPISAIAPRILELTMSRQEVA